MKLKATAGFSGALGSAGVGNIIEVDAKAGKEMLKQGYPVEEVQDESKRTAAKRSNKSPAPSS